MRHISLATILKLAVLCVIVGWGLAFFDLTPWQIARDLTARIGDVFGNVADWGGALVGYALMGAVVVIPVWLGSILLARSRTGGRGRRSED